MNETELKAFNQIIAASYSPAELRKLYRRSNPGLPLSIELALSAGAIVAYYRKASLKQPVAVINVFLGWTFIGWVVALAMAVKDSRG